MLLLVPVQPLADGPARRRVPLGGRDFQAADIAKGHDTLRASLPVRGLSHDDRPVVILERTRNDLRGARAFFVNQYRQRQTWPLLLGAVGEVTVRLGSAAAKADDPLTGAEEEVGHRGA